MVVPKLLTRTSVFRSCLMLSRSEKSFMAFLMKCLSARFEIVRRVIAVTSGKSSSRMLSRKCKPISPVEPIRVILEGILLQSFRMEQNDLSSPSAWLIRIQCCETSNRISFSHNESIHYWIEKVKGLLECQKELFPLTLMMKQS